MDLIVRLAWAKSTPLSMLDTILKEALSWPKRQKGVLFAHANFTITSIHFDAEKRLAGANTVWS